MAISSLHKEALLKLTNLFSVAQYNESDFEDIPVIRFKEDLLLFDLTTLPRIAAIILKFEKSFPYDSSNDCSREENQGNALYIQKITVLTEFIEENNLLKNSTLEILQHQQTSQHIQVLISLIRDWLLKFYIEKHIVHELFPTIDAEKTSFSLLDLKENNIFLITLLVINVFYQLRYSFPKFCLLLEFSHVYFNDLTPFLSLASLDRDYLSNLVQSSLLSLVNAEETESHLNMSLNQQMDALSNRFYESNRKRLIATMDSDKFPSKHFKSNDDDRSKALILSQRLTILNDSATNQSLLNKSANSAKFNEQDGIERPYKCDLCSKTFPTSYKLNRHSYSHNGDRPYVCTWPNCTKKFNDNYHLRRHMNTHTGEKPYQCNMNGCHKRYSRAEDLRSHQKTHNREAQPPSGSNATTQSSSGLSGQSSSILDRSDRLSLAAAMANNLSHGNFSVLTDGITVPMQMTANGGLLQSQLSKLQQLQVGPVNITNIAAQTEDSMQQPVIILENAASPSEPNPASGLHLPENYF